MKTCLAAALLAGGISAAGLLLPHAGAISQESEGLSGLIALFEQVRAALEKQEIQPTVLVRDARRWLAGADRYIASAHDTSLVRDLSDNALYLASAVARRCLERGDTLSAVWLLQEGVRVGLRGSPRRNSPSRLLGTVVSLLAQYRSPLPVERLQEEIDRLAELVSVRGDACARLYQHFLEILLTLRAGQIPRGIPTNTAFLKSGGCPQEEACGPARSLLGAVLRRAREVQRGRETSSADSLYLLACVLAPCAGPDYAAMVELERATHLANRGADVELVLKWFDRAIRDSRLVSARELERVALVDRFWFVYQRRAWDEALETGERLWSASNRQISCQKEFRALLAWASVLLKFHRVETADSVVSVLLGHPELQDEKTVALLASTVANLASLLGDYRAGVWRLARLEEGFSPELPPALKGHLLLVRLSLLQRLGEHRRITALVDSVLACGTSLPDTLVAYLYVARGNAQFRSGLMEEAIRSYERALGFAGVSLDLAVACASNWAYALGSIGRFGEAVDVCSRVYERVKNAGRPDLEADLLTTVGVLYAMEGKDRVAAKAQERAASLALAARDTVAYAEALANLAACLHRLGDSRRADSLYSAVCDLATAVGDEQTRLLALANRGAIRMQAGDYAVAESLLTVVGAGSELLLPDLRWRVQYQRGLLRLAEGRLQEARGFFEESVQQIEELRNPFTKEDYKLGFLSQRYQVYADLVGCLLQLAKEDSSCLYEAFAIAEKNKARVLVELFGRRAEARESGAKGAGSEVQVSLAKQGRELVRLLSSVLGDSTWLVEYVVAPSQIYAFIVSPEGSLGWRSLGVSEKWIDERVSLLYGFLSRPGTNTAANALQFLEAASELYEVLVINLPQEVQSARRIIIVPDGILSYLPFETLAPKFEDQILDFRDLPYWGAEADIAYAPSARTYLLLSRAKTGEAVGGTVDSVVVFADVAFQSDIHLPVTKPVRTSGQFFTRSTEGLNERLDPLPYTRYEANLIQQAVGGDRAVLLLGKDACEEAILGMAGRSVPKVLHIASHGIALNEAPKASGVVLASCGEADGYLTLSEIAGLHLPTALTVLSCCRTAVGKLYRGEGMDGICRAFLLAGSRSVVVTLWSVADKPSAELMGSFYREMFRSGKDPVAALTRAKRAMLRDRTYAHPFFWAPFVYVGGLAKPISLN